MTRVLLSVYRNSSGCILVFLYRNLHACDVAAHHRSIFRDGEGQLDLIDDPARVSLGQHPEVVPVICLFQGDMHSVRAHDLHIALAG